ncbi:hypothetical protein [Marinoscillum furvescens]|uniref:Uncharacterized protein n=1 Tax=Marinoscillum furvescens DSM 4134 TaxID=1122208 RepID=A0A3D9LG83_MARFU|nr:hypothetical protein [Marinoscillum furvescens]REE05648.1 hypothetical protein C7460_101165 [Marinoscillum furvescens DSM 4134]
MKITKRDVKCFVLGFLTLLVIEFAWNWNDHVESFKEGYRAGTSQDVK